MKLEQVASDLFELCSDRTRTSVQIAGDLVVRLGFIPARMSDIEDVVRKYKSTGVGLELAAHKIMTIAGQAFTEIEDKEFDYE